MRKVATLEALFPAVRAGVLSATILRPEHWWFLTEMADHLEVTPSSLQRELESLVSADLLLRRKDGRRTYFKANLESPLYPELQGLFNKTAGIVPALRDTLQKFGDRIHVALLYGSVARGSKRALSDVDVLMVGSIRQIDLLPALRRIEAHFGREINVTLFSLAEFRRKRALNDHFLSTLLRGKTILLKGALHDLEKAAAGAQTPPPPHQPSGGRRVAAAHRA